MDFTKAARIIFEKGYAYAGVRTLCDDEQYEAGDRCRESYEWDRDLDCSTYETTGEFANGTCATNIELPPYPDEDDLEEIAESIAKAAKGQRRLCRRCASHYRWTSPQH